MSFIFTLLASGITFVGLFILLLRYFYKPSNAANEEEMVQRPRGVPMVRGPAGNAPRRAVRNVRERMRAAVNHQDEDDDDEVQRPRGAPMVRGPAGNAPRRAVRNVRAVANRPDEDDLEDYDPLTDEIAMPEGKVGAKKLRKLEMKAEKKVQRERDLEDREERKRRQLELDERRKKQEDLEKEEELRKEAEEKALKEEKERQEHEEYLKLKEAFQVEEEGFEENIEEAHKFQDFIEYLKEQKVVLLEDLAVHFKLKTQDVINRVQDLLVQETIMGVMDDRGKFVYITKEELESVALFIKQRGRVSITELAESSNSLIKLQTESSLPVVS